MFNVKIFEKKKILEMVTELMLTIFSGKNDFRKFQQS